MFRYFFFCLSPPPFSSGQPSAGWQTRFHRYAINPTNADRSLSPPLALRPGPRSSVRTSPPKKKNKKFNRDKWGGEVKNDDRLKTLNTYLCIATIQYIIIVHNIVDTQYTMVVIMLNCAVHARQILYYYYYYTFDRLIGWRMMFVHII